MLDETLDRDMAILWHSAPDDLPNAMWRFVEKDPVTRGPLVAFALLVPVVAILLHFLFYAAFLLTAADSSIQANYRHTTRSIFTTSTLFLHRNNGQTIFRKLLTVTSTDLVSMACVLWVEATYFPKLGGNFTPITTSFVVWNIFRATLPELLRSIFLQDLLSATPLSLRTRIIRFTHFKKIIPEILHARAFFAVLGRLLVFYVFPYVRQVDRPWEMHAGTWIYFVLWLARVAWEVNIHVGALGVLETIVPVHYFPPHQYHLKFLWAVQKSVRLLLELFIYGVIDILFLSTVIVSYAISVQLFIIILWHVGRLVQGDFAALSRVSWDPFANYGPPPTHNDL